MLVMVFSQRPVLSMQNSAVLEEDFNKLSVQATALLTELERIDPTREAIRAYDFARESHGGQVRKDSLTPYIIHPTRVCLSLIREFGVIDRDVIIAALLHDTIEDCFVTEEQIARLFGKRAASMVASLSTNLFSCDEQYFDNIKNSCMEVKAIKIADRIDNLRSLASGTSRTKESVLEYVGESRDHILQFAEQAPEEIRRQFLELLAYLGD